MIETNTSPGSRALVSLKELFQSGHPLIYLCSPEESRIEAMLRKAAFGLFAGAVPIWTWSSTAGLTGADGASSGKTRLGARSVLDFIGEYSGAAIFHLKDFHEYLGNDPEIRRCLRDLYASCLDTRKFIVMSSPVKVLPQELDRQVAFLQFLAPDLDELQEFLREELPKFRDARVNMAERALFAMARALQGLTMDETRHALRRALAICGSLDESSLPYLLEEKKLVVNRTGLIQYVADGTRIDHVGGLEYLKKWLVDRRRLFLERDSLAAEIVPKGILVMGVSGCGKSLSVKAIASCFGLPLYRIDMIEIFSGRHGNPDAAFVDACRMAEMVAPAVVWFDEIEMGLDSSTNLGRIFAFFLTWMQEKARGLFVAATANRIDLLPAEVIRKGRFDEVFFIDLPGEEEREEIFSIHLSKRGIDPEGLELNRLKRITQGWTGAEIEQCVISALTEVRLEDRKMSFDDLHKAALTVIPLSKTMREQVDHIRSWAYDRAVRASPKG